MSAQADTLSARAEALARAEEEHAAALRAAAAGGSDEARGLAELRALMAEANARSTRARAQEAAFLAGYLAPKAAP